ncbi:alpha-1,4-digalacturonate transport system substrate-binding protein [Gracilibacillus ureilyticus]|uniref:Alpha-1,4-digalacturonate transport system substrate-binding protein n=1 Tax=Gracilibacillus ureilyticus TaxID=531814 RepID=A0A1H9U8C3_9BACI|nr:sugar ABC transporter substrate-binding protein [Gracilibacillus ureilyticus]SES05599.1 alpha-1,4-digalacturonate transport system substrate-binding protein [Gracilibacillus ureilyticus]
MKKAFLSVFILLTVILTACSGDSESQSGSEGEAGSNEEKMQFYVSGDTVEGSALTKMSEKYTEETGIEIEVVDVPYEDMVTKITNMMRAEEPPALARVTGFNPAWNGKLMDLTEIAEKNNVMTDMGITVDDKLVAPPLDLTAVGMFINKSLFEEAGVSYPENEEDIWTWEEFLNAINTVVEKTDAQYGMVMDNSEHRLNAFLYQHGSKGFYQDGDEYTTNDETKDALQRFIDMNDNTIMPKAVWTAGEDASSMFKSGRVAAYMSGSWQITDFASNIKDFEWESVYMPYEDVRATNLGGNYLVGFEGSGQEEQAKEFIDWLYQKENYEELATYGGYLPVTENAEVEYELAPEAYQIYQNEIAASDPIASQQRNELVRKQLVSQRSLGTALADEVMKALNEEITIDEAIENVKKSMTDAYVE